MSQVRRRQFLIAAGALLAVPVAKAQQRATARRIAYLGVTLAHNPTSPAFNSFRAGMRDLGWIDGQNLVIEHRWSPPDQVAERAAELVALKPELIVAGTNSAAVPLKRLTASIPIIVVGTHAPIEVGLVASLSHPGSNVTGTVSMAADLDVKRVELLKTIVPKLSSIDFVYTEVEPAWRFHLKEIEEAGRLLGVSVRAQSADDFDAAFAAMASHRPDALLVQTDAVSVSRRQRIIELSQVNRMPAMFEFRMFVEAGGLMSYGPDLSNLWYRGAYYADRILKGARPSDLPMEQPTKFELAVNLKTAKTLGIKIPKTVVLRADRVIE